MRWIMLFMLPLIIVGAVAAVPLYLGPDDLSNCPRPDSGKCAAADAIVAVSGGDTLARADEAILLYERGWAPLIIFSGAAADTSGPSNAEAMRQYAIEQGIPNEAILTEEFSRTTAENAQNTSQFLRERQIDRVILVTSVYHQRRAGLEFGERVGGGVNILNHPTRSDDNWRGAWWLTSRGWSLAVGELTKIAIFYVSKESPR